MQTIFLSYCWQDSDFADAIDIAFQPTGIRIRRDIREIKYKDSIKEYMQQIREVDFALILLSDHFLKSTNCMYEVLEILKEKDFKIKVLPVLVTGTHIFKPVDKLGYIKYWNGKYEELKEQLQGVEVTSAIELYKDLKHYKNISESIDSFFSYVTDINIVSTSELIKTNFKELFNHLGIADHHFNEKILAISRIKDLEERDIQLDLLEKEFPNTAQIAFVKGSLAFENKQLRKSSHYYSVSIELNPNFAPSYYNLAYNIESEGKINEAIEMYEKAIEKDPQSSRAINNLARMNSINKKDFRKARELYELALKIKPNDAEANYNLALLLEREFADYETAKYYYQNSIKLEPEVYSYLSYGLLLWKKLGNLSESAAQFKCALEIDPNNKEVLEKFGELQEFGFKHYKTAKLYYDRFIQINPTPEEHYSYSTFLLHDSFDSEFRELAIKHYEHACNIQPSLRDLELERYFFNF